MIESFIMVPSGFFHLYDEYFEISSILSLALEYKHAVSTARIVSAKPIFKKTKVVSQQPSTVVAFK